MGMQVEGRLIFLLPPFPFEWIIANAYCPLAAFAGQPRSPLSRKDVLHESGRQHQSCQWLYEAN